MKVVFDARWIGREPSGIGIYSRELLRRIPGLAPELEFVVLFRDRGLAGWMLEETGLSRQPNLRSHCLPYGVFSPLGQLRLPLLLRRMGARVFHSPNYLLPYFAFPRDRRGTMRAVTTVHDVIPLVVPGHAPRSRKSRLWPLFVFCLRQTVARSDVVITVSDASRRDLIRAMRLGPARSGRIRKVYNGVDAVFSPPAQDSAARPPDRPRTLLYVGRLDPYKNVVLLVRAFAALRRQVDFPLRLRIVGPPDPRYPEACDAAVALGVAEDVKFEGFMDEEDLARAYREADVLAHPSRYEGFGLQIVEAMGSGLPVVCAAAGAMPEVAAGAALLVPPNDEQALRQALCSVLCDRRLAARLAAAGRRRAAGFTWDRSAAATLALYRELADGERFAELAPERDGFIERKAGREGNGR